MIEGELKGQRKRTYLAVDTDTSLDISLYLCTSTSQPSDALLPKPTQEFVNITSARADETFVGIGEEAMYNMEGRKRLLCMSVITRRSPTQGWDGGYLL